MTDLPPTPPENPASPDGVGDTTADFHRGVAASSAMLLVAQLGVAVGYFLAVLLLARWFGPDERGAVAFATLSVLLLSRLSRLGVPESASVYVASHPHLRSVILANQLVFAWMASLISGGCFVGALLLTGARPTGITVATMVVVAIGTVLNSTYETLLAYLVAAGQTRTAAAANLIQPWGWVIGLVATRELYGITPSRTVIAWAVPFVFACAVCITAAIRKNGIARPNVRVLADAIRFGFPAWIGGVSTFVNYRLDQVLMGFISTRPQLGLYAVGVNASEVLLYLANATSSTLTPAIARGDQKLIAERALRVYRSVAALTILSTLVAVSVGPFALPLVFGRRYDGSISPFIVLALGAIGWTTSIILSSALLGARSSRLSSVGSVVALMVGIVLDVALIPPLGALGAAIATTCGFYAAAAAAVFAFKRRFDVPRRAFIPGRDDLRGMLSILRPGR
jgi:O-antigen/teichoic acid export membrane protein